MIHDGPLATPDVTPELAEWCYQRIVEAGAPDWMRSRARAVIRELRWDELRRRHRSGGPR